MENTDSQPFMQLLASCLGDSFKPEHRGLTKTIMKDEVIILQPHSSPVCFVLGWDAREKFNVISLN
ncbi:MAG TPA: hypothetical protein DDX98_14295 [Bacteroidales bacterium]|jgi:hypothetical protein|nr:hypothetical protein [Bacteroidales bacterium]